MEKGTVLKIKRDANPNLLAGAIASMARNGVKAELQAIGAGAVNQGVKAVAIARSYLASSGIDLVVMPFFKDIEVDNGTRTMICMTIKRVDA